MFIAQLLHHWRNLRKDSPAAAGRLRGQRNRRGHADHCGARASYGSGSPLFSSASVARSI